MTNSEKQKITELKKNGYGYKKIAAMLNITVGSVRNALSSVNEECKCKFCGKTLKFVEGKKKKVFCNDSCRYSFWNAKRRSKK